MAMLVITRWSPGFPQGSSVDLPGEVISVFGDQLQDLSENDLDKARLGLGHAFSRHRMQLDPNRQERFWSRDVQGEIYSRLRL